MTSPPLIAINGLALTKPRSGLRLDDQYPQAILSAGGTPIAICPLGNSQDLGHLLSHTNGLLLTGGDDFDMEHLGRGTTHPKAKPTSSSKQDFDFRLLAAAEKIGLPTLGICYGMQLMGVAHGATLLQHLPEDRPGCQEHSGGCEHEVLAQPKSKLAHCTGIERMTVISKHHQALENAPEGWIVSARDSQGLVEAIEDPREEFMLGVQWHPELSGPEGPNGRILRAFVDAATQHASTQSATTNIQV